MTTAVVLQVALLVAMVLIPAGTFAGKPSSDPAASTTQVENGKGKSEEAKAKKGSTETQTAPTTDAKPGKGTEKKSDPATKGNGGSKGKSEQGVNKPDKGNQGNSKKTEVVAETTVVAAALGEPTITSDKADYPPGGKVVLTGTNWQGDEPSGVQITVNDDAGKSWSRGVIVDVRPGRHDQGQFQPARLVRGHVHRDGDRPRHRPRRDDHVHRRLDRHLRPVLQRRWRWDTPTSVAVDQRQPAGQQLDVSGGRRDRPAALARRIWSRAAHTVTFKYGTTKAGKHAYDYLTTWNWSENWITVGGSLPGHRGLHDGETTPLGRSPIDPNAAVGGSTAVSSSRCAAARCGTATRHRQRLLRR